MIAWLSDRRVAVPVGLAAVAISLVLIFPAPVVFPGVVAWWLHLDLADGADDRPGALGIAALALFGIVGAGVAVLAISLDSHLSCGGTFGGLGESASARLDQNCVAARGWRPVLGAVAVLISAVVAGVRLRRDASAKWDVPRAATISTGLTVILVLVTALLVLT